MRRELGDIDVPDLGDVDTPVEWMTLAAAIEYENDAERRVGDANPDRVTCNLHKAWSRYCGCAL